jgi:hypothetical protein
MLAIVTSKVEYWSALLDPRPTQNDKYNRIIKHGIIFTIMEEHDQSSLHPLLERLETNMCRTRVACVAGEHSSKELFEQLVYLLCGTTTCAGILPSFSSRGFSPRHSMKKYLPVLIK